MAHIFVSENEVRQILTIMQEDLYMAGLMCELCYHKNFRLSDIQYARAGYFKDEDGTALYYLKGDKTETDEWVTISGPIYLKVRDWIRKNRFKPDDYIFWVKTQQPGPYQGHEGVITLSWVRVKWYDACRKAGIYTEVDVPVKDCHNCEFAVDKKKCRILGDDRIRNRVNIHIKNCIKKEKTFMVKEKHPRLHETLRGAGAQARIRYYMENRGMGYTEAKELVFLQSNWKNRKTMDRYLDSVVEREIGNETFSEDFGDRKIV